MSIDWRYNFKWQYQYARNLILDTSKFDPSWASLILAAQRLMTPMGFDQGEAGVLARLREKSIAFDKETNVADQGVNLLKAVDAWHATAGGLIAQEPKLRASALKFLQSMHLLEFSGERCVWIHSLPAEFGTWAVLQMRDEAGTTQAAATLLRSQTAHFTELQRKYLAGATMHALAWVQKANMLLATAANPGSGNAAAVEAACAVVRRWFADPKTTQEELESYFGILASGLKAVTATLNKGKLVLTDFVPLRRASTAQETSLFGSEAFVFANKWEGMDVVYIEQAFFSPPAAGILEGPKNWARVIIHELTHLDCNTIDVPFGENARYAWAGIGPHAGFPGRDAIRNADSWAFFCADCAGVLTEGERLNALRKT